MTMREALQQLAEAAQQSGQRLYLVGGWVRDALLGLPEPRNVDLAIPRGAVAFAERMARRLGGHFVLLDAEHGSARIVCQQADTAFEVDLSDFRGASIEHDLRLRDFTVNAMAYDLAAHLEGHAVLLDPLGAHEDLRAKRLRATSPQAFRDDAVRILRGSVFAARLGFHLEAQTAGWMRAAVPQLSSIAAERVREELFKLFTTAQSSPHVRFLDEIGVLDAVIPEIAACRGVAQGGYHHLDVWDHSLETLQQLEEILAHPEAFPAELREPVAAYLQAPIRSLHPRSALLKFSALLHDIGKPAKKIVNTEQEIWFTGHEHHGADLAVAIAQRLRLSVDEQQSLERIVTWHLRPGYLVKEPERTRRAIYRYFRDTGDDAPAVLLHWLADRAASRGPATDPATIPQQREIVFELLRHYFLRPEETVRLPKLVRGDELMAALGLLAGPLIGQLLRQIEEAQAERQVTTRDEALAFAKQVVAQRR